MLRIAVVEDDDRDYANLKNVLDRFQKEKKAPFLSSVSASWPGSDGSSMTKSSKERKRRTTKTI